MPTKPKASTAPAEPAEAVVWEGADALRPFLVPIGELEPFPGNPRRGDVEAIRASLRRFGQVKALVVDGTRIVAHHHVRLAAEAEGWTHVAAIPNTFADEDEARAFLVTDNRTSDLGGYDTAELVDHLRILDELDALPGTGYDNNDLDALLAELARAGQPPAPPAAREPMQRSEHREIVLMYGPDQYDQVVGWLHQLAERTGTPGNSETVYEALRLAVEP